MWYYLSIYKFFNLFTLNQCKDMKIPPFFQKKSTIKFHFIVKIYLTLGIRGIKITFTLILKTGVMKKLLFILAFFMPFIAFTSCSKDEVSSTDDLAGTKWEGNIGLGDLVIATLQLEFQKSTFTASVRMDLNGDGQITADEEEVSTGTYTVDGNYIYLTIEGETEKAELRDGKIVLKVTDWDGESIPMEFILEQV